MLNCLSFDIEGFVESNVQSIRISEGYRSREKEVYEIEKNVEILLDFLSEQNVKATFFVLGTTTRDLPGLVKKISDCGHELGSHGQKHSRIYGLTEAEFKEDMFAAKKHLEDTISKKVFGFRAPDFSITKASIWALDVLKEAGFLYDSSIYPFGLHDAYGLKSASPFIHKLPNGLIEFPLSTIECFGKRWPFGGGGYFRLFPLFFTDYCIRKTNKLGEPMVFYLHPYEVGPEIPSIPNISPLRKFRHYYNCQNGAKRLRKIVSKHKFGTAMEVISKKSLGGTEAD